MIKRCVVLNGTIINVGEWDYQYDSEGNAQNPFPEGAVVEERDFEYTEEHGWREVGFVPKPSEVELLQEKVAMQETVIEELMFIIIPELTGGGI